MAAYCEILYVVMREYTGEIGMHPAVMAIFESREKADAYVATYQAERPLSFPCRYYIDTSFHNVLED